MHRTARGRFGSATAPCRRWNRMPPEARCRANRNAGSDTRPRRTARLGRRRGGGGAMPYSRSLRRPASLIQSVVQAGDSTVRTRRLRQPGARQRGCHFHRDHPHGRAAGVGRGDRDLHSRRRRRPSTSRSTPRSAMVSTGISGSSPRPRRPRPVRAVRHCLGRSPGRPRIGALQMLHLGQQMAKVLAVPPARPPRCIQP